MQPESCDSNALSPCSPVALRSFLCLCFLLTGLRAAAVLMAHHSARAGLCSEANPADLDYTPAAFPARSASSCAPATTACAAPHPPTSPFDVRHGSRASALREQEQQLGRRRFAAAVCMQHKEETGSETDTEQTAAARGLASASRTESHCRFLCVLLLWCSVRRTGSDLPPDSSPHP